MTRYVRRRKKQWPPPPWSNPARIDPRHPCPRTLLGNTQVKVLVRYKDRKVEVGTYDYTQRLYQHAPGPKGFDSLTMKVNGEVCVMYNLQAEWYKMKNSECLWIELNDKSTGLTRRVAFAKAEAVGFATDTPNGPRWAVPLDAYTEHERDD